MSSKLIILIFYLITATVYTFGLAHNFLYCRLPQYDILVSAREKLQFLTVWDSVCKIKIIIFCFKKNCF